MKLYEAVVEVWLVLWLETTSLDSLKRGPAGIPAAYSYVLSSKSTSSCCARDVRRRVSSFEFFATILALERCQINTPAPIPDPKIPNAARTIMGVAFDGRPDLSFFAGAIVVSEGDAGE